MHRISHFTTPPHTPQHNGSAERRHCHLVEIGLTLLHQACIQLKYWSYAFETAVYLINRLPTPILNFKSPYTVLLAILPTISNYVFLVACAIHSCVHTTQINLNQSLALAFS